MAIPPDSWQPKGVTLETTMVSCRTATILRSAGHSVSHSQYSHARTAAAVLYVLTLAFWSSPTSPPAPRATSPWSYTGSTRPRPAKTLPRSPSAATTTTCAFVLLSLSLSRSCSPVPLRIPHSCVSTATRTTFACPDRFPGTSPLPGEVPPCDQGLHGTDWRPNVRIRTRTIHSHICQEPPCRVCGVCRAGCAREGCARAGCRVRLHVRGRRLRAKKPSAQLVAIAGIVSVSTLALCSGVGCGRS